MAKGIILRVLEGTELTSALTQALGKILPDYKLETYKKAPDYKSSFKRRIDSLYDAFLFVLDAYPLDPKFTPITAETLRAYAAECKAACTLTKDTFEEQHKEVELFTAKMVEILSVCWSWPGTKPVKEATACLNEAECYRMMMDGGRPNIATLTTIERKGEKEFVLQYDESLPPYYDRIIAELERLKGLKYPKTPAWLRKLSEFEQAYFCNLSLKSITPADVIQDLNKFSESWSDIKSKSLNIIKDLGKISANMPPLPTWYNALSVHQQAMVKVLASDSPNFSKNLEQFKSKLADLATKADFKNTLALIPKIPQWYWVIPRRQQYFLEHVLKTAKKTEDALDFISSRLRVMPLPSNLAVHRSYILNAKGEVVEQFGERHRSSHIATRDMLKSPEAVQSRHSESNLAKVMEKAKPGVPCLMQTLISPIHMADYVPSVVTDYLPELPPDLELYKLARTAVGGSKRSKDIWQHNHPMNFAKRIYYTSSTDADSLALLENAGKYRSTMKDAAGKIVSTTPVLDALLDDYESVLKSPLGSATFWDYDGRELFLSSLEQLIILTIGGYSYGSCVSGKDRKALELIHTDAMMLYKSLYGAWPKFGDPKEKVDRVRFVELFVGLYVSRHQQVHAGQNAPGSEGIKTPGWYLPKDIAEAINKFLDDDRSLARDDRLASVNEVTKISKNLKSYLLPPNQLLCQLIARQLGEKTCTKLYDALSALVQETRRFHKAKEGWSLALHKKAAPSIPAGIDEIRTLMRDERTGADNVRRIGALLAIPLDRPVSDGSRTKATVSVYERMRAIVRPDKNGTTPTDLAEEAVDEWSRLFEASKGVTALSEHVEASKGVTDPSEHVAEILVF